MKVRQRTIPVTNNNRLLNNARLALGRFICHSAERYFSPITDEGDYNLQVKMVEE
jgi:hypothetical protein